MKVKVILKLDIYRHVNTDRSWERQVWTGEMPERPNPSEYDPLLLQKEYEYGAENVIFRLDGFDRERMTATYRPVVFHSHHWFLDALPKWGFKLDTAMTQEVIQA